MWSRDVLMEWDILVHDLPWRMQGWRAGVRDGAVCMADLFVLFSWKNL